MRPSTERRRYPRLLPQKPTQKHAPDCRAFPLDRITVRPTATTIVESERVWFTFNVTTSSCSSSPMTSLEPRTVAVIGAGTDRHKFGNKSVRAHLRAGYTVYPVHPTATVIEGLPAYRSVKDVPTGKLDRVTFYVAPAVGLAVLRDVAAKSPAEVWFNPGAESPELLAKARELGLNAIAGCSIVDLGLFPAMFPDE